MSKIADDLGTTYFQLSTVGVGAVAVGVEDIRQRIYNVLNTIPGSDPFRPLFGCLAYTWTDKPVNTAVPNIKKEIFESLSLWMPEIQVKSITHVLNGDSNYQFNITYTIVDDDLLDSITFSIGGAITGSNSANSIIISAVVPAKVTNGIYKVFFVVNGSAVLPANPPFGFDTADDMLTWINNNWSSYGRWYLTGTSLVLYLNNGMATTASLNVTETSVLTVKAQIPNITSDEFLNLAFTVNGGAPSVAYPTNTFNTIGDMLLWIQTNWLIYGSWFVQVGDAGVVVVDGDFNGDFNPDFYTTDTTVDIQLVFQSSLVDSATLSFV
jgi:phage baseplate assembly protein W